MSRFNVLYHGEASDAAEELDRDAPPSANELQVALVNALRRIAQLERRALVLESLAVRRDKRRRPSGGGPY